LNSYADIESKDEDERHKKDGHWIWMKALCYESIVLGPPIDGENGPRTLDSISRFGHKGSVETEKQ